MTNGNNYGGRRDGAGRPPGSTQPTFDEFRDATGDSSLIAEEMLEQTGSDTPYKANVRMCLKAIEKQRNKLEEIAEAVKWLDRKIAAAETVFSSKLEALEARLLAVEDMATDPNPKPKPTHKGMKTMLHEMGLTRNEAAAVMMHHHLKIHMRENGLVAIPASEGSRFELYPTDSCAYAKEKVLVLKAEGYFG